MTNHTSQRSCFQFQRLVDLVQRVDPCQNCTGKGLTGGKTLRKCGVACIEQFLPCSGKRGFSLTPASPNRRVPSPAKSPLYSITGFVFDIEPTIVGNKALVTIVIKICRRATTLTTAIRTQPITISSDHNLTAVVS